MGVAAVLFAIVTVLIGVVVLGDATTGEAGSGPGTGSGKPTSLAATHVAIALTGVVVLLIALVEESSGAAWVSLAVLVVAGALGLATLSLTRGLGPDPVGPPSPHGVALPVVVAHGLAALMTVTLVFLTAGSVAHR